MPPKKETFREYHIYIYTYIDMHMSIIYMFERVDFECIRLRGRCQSSQHRGWHVAWQATGAPDGDGGFQE